jgi:hypothetical protein
MLELSVLRAELTKKDMTIGELLARDASRVAEMKRIESRFADLAGDHDALATAKARIAELEAQVETLTAPPAAGGSGDPTDPAKKPGGRATRTG